MKQLEKLNYNNGRVVEFDVADDGLTINIEEACDGHFSQAFNKSEFGELIDELKELHSRMKDERTIKEIEMIEPYGMAYDDEPIERKPVSNPVKEVVSCDLSIEVICDFTNAWEEHNNDNCLNNKPFKSVSSFMLEYCEQLRAKAK
jgi:hypothetical protein